MHSYQVLRKRRGNKIRETRRAPTNEQELVRNRILFEICAIHIEYASYDRNGLPASNIISASSSLFTNAKRLTNRNFKLQNSCTLVDQTIGIIPSRKKHFPLKQLKKSYMYMYWRLQLPTPFENSMLLQLPANSHAPFSHYIL